MTNTNLWEVRYADRDGNGFDHLAGYVSGADRAEARRLAKEKYGPGKICLMRVGHMLKRFVEPAQRPMPETKIPDQDVESLRRMVQDCDDITACNILHGLLDLVEDLRRRIPK